MTATTFYPGDPAPWFRAATTTVARFNFDTVAGRHVALLFYGTAGVPQAKAALDAVVASRHIFDDRTLCFFGVTADPADVDAGRVAEHVPGIRHFVDNDRAVSTLYGRIETEGGKVSYAPLWIVLDPTLRVVFTAPIGETEEVLRRLAAIQDRPLPSLPAPVLVVPRVIEPAMCRQLVDLYEARGGQSSGFMREIDGKTVAVRDTAFKRRADCQIEDEALRTQLRLRLHRRLVPEIRKAFQFEATRIERYIVACYDGGEQGFFRAHRDNTTPGTAHRRFAVTINLNAEEYDGGNLRFPEFGEQSFRAPTGGAVVFSCSLLHEAQPVTRGRRYAFLPFLYDDAGAKIREANLHTLDLEERPAA
ncbi:2OG-Fe(II) oxygenase [Sphingomonas sp. ID0503]|uniref:2OG-Fe(II) oxygenase n=1 Tax=Sphingomonas sp. ID0503 TaxID=3399691 RepID=UPI003AFA1398